MSRKFAERLSLLPLHGTSKPCRLHRHSEHHSRSLLAQFGLTPKSKRGWGAGEPITGRRGTQTLLRKHRKTQGEMEHVKSSSSICSSLDDFVACATVPAEEIFFINTLDDIAATAAGELSRFIEQGFCTREFNPIEGHVRPFYLRFRLGSYVA